MTTLNSVVYVVDDDPALCNAIQWLFKSVKIEVKIFNSGQTYLDAYDPTHTGCLLLDIRMPIMGGFELLEELKKRNNRMPIIIITGHGDVPMAVRAMKEGAVDFILKPFDDEALLEKVQKAIASDKKRQNVLNDSVYKDCINRMTPREVEVMKSIAEGKLSKQIANELHVSTSTIDFHRGNLMRKLKVKTVAELVKVYLVYSAAF